MAFPILALSIAANLSVTLVPRSNTNVPFTAEQSRRLFSGAGCLCQAPLAARLAFPEAQSGLPDRTVELWAGTDCATLDATRDQRCRKLAGVSLLGLADGSAAIVDLTAAQVMFPVAGTCSATSGTTTLFALVDENGDGTVDDTWTSDPVSWDAQPPPAPGAPSTVGSEDAVKVSWTVPSGTTDVSAYQILCARADGKPLYAVPSADPVYRVATDFDSCAAPGSVPPAGGGLDGLDPAYICSGEIGGTATGTTISLTGVGALPGDGEVRTRVVAVDAAGNATAVSAGQAAGILVRDGWEIYKDAGGLADGGYCFVATAAYGDYDHPYVKVLRRFRDQVLAGTSAGRAFIRWYYRHSPAWAAYLRRHPVVRTAAALALLPVVLVAWIWLSVPGWVLVVLLGLGAALLVRRRRRRAVTALPAIALVLMMLGGDAGRARADELELGMPVVRPPAAVAWTLGLSAGPYYPEVDSELPGAKNPPFYATFGDSTNLLLQARLERRFAVAGGQLAIAAGAGWMSDTALAFLEDPTTGKSTGVRSADETTFHLVPLTLMLVYHFTLVADRTGVPVVPYAGAGLAYDLWWFTRADGNVSTTGNDRAAGGTLGWQALAGVAIRIDALDRDAARTLEREIGIHHANVFFEVTTATVDGLGQANRLHVGDTTWNAGLRFDF